MVRPQCPSRLGYMPLYASRFRSYRVQSGLLSRCRLPDRSCRSPRFQPEASPPSVLARRNHLYTGDPAVLRPTGWPPTGDGCLSTWARHAPKGKACNNGPSRCGTAHVPEPERQLPHPHLSFPAVTSSVFSYLQNYLDNNLPVAVIFACKIPRPLTRAPLSSTRSKVQS